METEHAKEFDFFAFETKIRGIVSELIGPAIRRVTNHEELIERLSKHDQSHQKRLDELEFISGQSLKKIMTIDDISKNLTELRNQKNTQDANNMFRFESLNTSIENNQHQMENLLINFSNLQENQFGIRGLVEEGKNISEKERKSIRVENLQYREEM